MGAVYKARHPTLQKTVIIKKLTLTGSQDFVERFRREAQLMMEFRNEKIVQVYDHFKEENAYHIVMEYVDGITLEDLIAKRRFLSEDAALLIFSEICDALKYAHDRQVIHRDIKPANILISKDGVVKLVDFGVSANLEASDDDGLTKAGMTIGTPSYLAPEQIANARNRDKRSDIYSMGVMLYEMILGKKPFRGGFTPEVIARIEKGKYTHPRKVNPKIKRSTQGIVKKAMHHKVKKRFQDLGVILKKTAKFLKPFKTQEDIYSAIRLYLEGKDSLSQPKKKRLPDLSGKATGIGIASVIVLILAGAGVLWGIQNQLHHEWLDGENLGALQVKVKVKKGRKEADENYLHAKLYAENRQGSLKEVKDVRIQFQEDKELESKSYYTFKSEKIYLPQKMYMLLLYAENEQFRENFYLSPRIRQREILSMKEGRQITFTIERNMPELPVKVEFKFFAVHSGRDISKKTEMAVYANSTWKEWRYFVSGLRSGGFFSGNRYKLRFRNPDYQDKYYNLTIQPEQTSVNLKINLAPKPGSLYFKTDTEDVRLLINDSEYFYDESGDRSYRKLSSPTGKNQIIRLSPGEYRITAESSRMILGSSTVKKNIRIQSNEKVYLTISKSPDDDSLRINIH